MVATSPKERAGREEQGRSMSISGLIGTGRAVFHDGSLTSCFFKIKIARLYDNTQKGDSVGADSSRGKWMRRSQSLSHGSTGCAG